MNALSVNISTSERKQIQAKAVTLFIKTAKARHPDETFYADITKRIFSETLEKYRQFIDTEIFASLPFTSYVLLGNKIGRLMLPNNLEIYTLIESNHTGVLNLLIANRSLAYLDKDEFYVPEEFKKDRDVLFPFTKYGADHLEISEGLIKEIEEYNAKMLSTYTDLTKQLKGLLYTIEESKTTKAFSKKLPNLESLYPKSLQAKINKKNSIDAELTEEQQLMQDATNAIATANLLED